MLKDSLISVIIPTYNEAENIQSVLEGIVNNLDNKKDIGYEIIVVDDDSSDKTVEIAEAVLKNNGKVVRRREVTKSLSLSVLEGIEESNGDIIVIMDGDGSHPADLIPVFISNIKDGYDLIIGSRYVPGGGTKYFPLSRKIISRFACFLGKIVTRVKDNTSGFICVKKNALKGVNLTPAGFKIGLEIFVKADYHKFKEIPYIFINRRKGESKLKGITVLEYICQIVRLLRYRNSKYRKTCS